MVTSSFSAGPTPFENISWNTMKFVLKYQQRLFRSFPSILEMKLYHPVFPVLQLTPPPNISEAVPADWYLCKCLFTVT
jgi:hypothetical protein